MKLRVSVNLLKEMVKDLKMQGADFMREDHKDLKFNDMAWTKLQPTLCKLLRGDAFKGLEHIFKVSSLVDQQQ